MIVLKANLTHIYFYFLNILGNYLQHLSEDCGTYNFINSFLLAIAKYSQNHLVHFLYQNHTLSSGMEVSVFSVEFYISLMISYMFTGNNSA